MAAAVTGTDSAMSCHAPGLRPSAACLPHSFVLGRAVETYIGSERLAGNPLGQTWKQIQGY